MVQSPGTWLQQAAATCMPHDTPAPLRAPPNPHPHAPAALVLLNPHAGGGTARALHAHVERHLHTHHPHAALCITHEIADAERAIDALPHRGRVVLCGGDGTVHQLLPALLRGAHELALVPVGSGNDTARALGVLGLRGGWPARLDWALRAPASAVDLGELVCEGGHRALFISSLAAGFDAAVALRAHAGPRWLRGMPRYLWATLRELIALRVCEVTVSDAGRTLHSGRTLFASALNGPTYGSGMPAVPGARLDDGALDLLVAGAFGRLGVLVMLPRLLLGRHLGHPRVHVFSGAGVQVHASSPLPLAADGEPAPAAARFTLRTLRGALQCVRYPSV